MAENTNNGTYDVEWRGDQDHDGKRNFPVIVLGWLSCDIIKNCLRSINLLEGVNPQIYFVENKSKNSDEIKELILNTENIKGYIQYKENFAANVWKVTLEHFLPQINEEFVTITDGDYIFDVDAIDTQYALFEEYDDVGITSQEKSLLMWPNKPTQGQTYQEVRRCGENWKAMYGHYTEKRIGKKIEYAINPSLKRSIHNGMLLTTARKTDWQKFIDCVNYRDIQMTTYDLSSAPKEVWRPPLFVDGDLYRFFEIVMGKQSLIVQAFPAYHLTDEYTADPNSEYSIEKNKFNYEESFQRYAKDFEYHHNSHYPDGELKFDIIK